MNLVWAGNPPSPGSLGIHAARMSDQAQLQVMMDEFTSAPGDITRQQFLAARWNMDLPTLHQTLNFLRNGENPQNISASLNIYEKTATMEMETGETMTFRKKGHHWRITAIAPPAARHAQVKAELNDHYRQLPEKTETGFSAGQTFISVPLSAKYNLDKLTRQDTQSHLNRLLFAAPEKSAAYYAATYSKQAPYVRATYVQLVLDPVWNRIVYGSLGHWIKAYMDVRGPTAIAVDPQGRVFVGESGRKRILVLTLHPDEENTELHPAFSFSGVTQPTAIAHHDNGTPFNVDDDFLYVADGAENVIHKFSITETDARKENSFEGFESPTAVICGKSFGSNNRLLYVIDGVGRRLQLFEDTGDELSLLEEVIGQPDQYFSDVKSDYYGNIYLVDQPHSRLYKFSPMLEQLAVEEERDTYNGLVSVNIPSGKITIEGEGTYWAGYDQLFALERWTETSGVQRRMLGIAIKNFTLSEGSSTPDITSRFLLTDVGDISLIIEDEAGHEIRQISSGWMAAGQKVLKWDRRDKAGNQLPPGLYHYRVQAASAYREENTKLDVQFYLPLFYWQNCGSTNTADDHFRVQGNPVRMGEAPMETGVRHAERVIYRFSGLNPDSRYELAVQGFSADGVQRQQHILINNDVELGPVTGRRLTREPNFLPLPKETFTKGVVTVTIENVESGDAAVSQIWLKETGAGLNAHQLPETGIQPNAFVLEQNYPNPFNPSTTIQYQVPHEAVVRLEIFNVLGQRVRQLVNERRSPGVYTVVWDGKSDQGIEVASGIYFYRLHSGSLMETKRMLLIR